MRRPLLQPDGTPLFQAAAGFATLFDASDLDPAYTYAVTLYAWFPQPSASTTVAVGIQTDGVVVPTGIWLGTDTPIDAFRSNGIGPAKVMDRVVIRGNQQVVVVGTAGYGTAGVTWWGYVERAGVAPMPTPYLPLRPVALAADFPGIPTLINIPVTGSVQTVTQTIHMLDGTDERRMDILDLYISCLVDAAPGSATQSCILKVPGGVDIPLPVYTGATIDAAAGSPIHLYDGIPVRAPTTSDNLFQLEVTGTADQAVTAVAYGRYARS